MFCKFITACKQLVNAVFNVVLFFGPCTVRSSLWHDASSVVCLFVVVCNAYIVAKPYVVRLALIPLDRAMASSYRQSIVTLCLSAVVWLQF